MGFRVQDLGFMGLGFMGVSLYRRESWVQGSGFKLRAWGLGLPGL